MPDVTDLQGVMDRVDAEVDAAHVIERLLRRLSDGDFDRAAEVILGHDEWMREDARRHKAAGSEVFKAPVYQFLALCKRLQDELDADGEQERQAL